MEFMHTLALKSGLFVEGSHLTNQLLRILATPRPTATESVRNSIQTQSATERERERGAGSRRRGRKSEARERAREAERERE